MAESPRPDALGSQIDKVSIQIDYAIVQHFSEHLYGSPNKAIEELVANSFDAWAQRTYVYIPGAFTDRRLLVWDDGESMDQAAFHQLWWIARSPKEDNEGRIQTREGRSPRALIGKFGIGKLASYAVGFRVTHLCRRDDQFLRVTVDYRGVPQLEGDSESESYDAPIMELSEDEAQAYAKTLFTQQPAAWKAIWDKDSWTLAIVDELKPEIDLKAGRLSWVLGNGMPYRPDFQAFVNDAEIKPRLESGAEVTWDLSHEQLQTALKAKWEAAAKRGEVDGTFEFVDHIDEYDGKPGVVLPALGPVSCEARIFDRSLLDNRASDMGRSHGFFVFVRDRLLNPDNAQLFLDDPSFATFYSTQFIIHADGLDKVILADRERLRTVSPSTSELRVVQDAVYAAARTEVDRRADVAASAQTSESLLPVESREYFREPLIALMVKHDRMGPVDLSYATVDRTAAGESEPVAVFDEHDGRFRVNTEHPLFSSLQRRLGGGTKAREALRAIDVFFISERLMEGYLWDLGVSPDHIDHILDWRDGLFRLIAKKYAGAHEELVSEAYEASYKGDKPFEQALRAIFGAMGFEAEHRGESGKEDIFVYAPIGTQEFKFIVEAKGSGVKVANGPAEVGAAANHRDKANAEFAVIVAREFSGFDKERPEGAALLGECEATGDVFIANLETVVQLYEAVRRFAYPLGVVRDVLAILERPDEKLTRVQDLQHPELAFDFRSALDAIWNEQKGRAHGDVVSYRPIFQTRDEWRDLSFPVFEHRLVSMETLSRGLLKVTTSNETVIMLQSPELVAEQIAMSVAESEVEDPGDDVA